MPKVYLVLLSIYLSGFQVSAKSSLNAEDSIPDAPLIHRAQLDSLLSLNDDTTRIINFWATWCRPCVAELPTFFEMENTIKNQSVKFIYVSLDFKRELTGALRKFIQTRHLHNTILLLDEPDYNAWIDKVHPSWSGALPATVFMRNSEKQYRFAEKDFTFAELDSVIKTLLPR